MKIREIIRALEDFAPLALQDSYDNAGMQIGLAEDADATGALLCLDVTEDVVREAIALGCNLIVSHHPLLFRPLKQISGRDYIERTVMLAIKHDITIYSAHTNLDSAPGGVNYKMAEKLGLNAIEWLNPKPGTVGGEGIIGYLEAPMAKADFVKKVSETFGVECCRHNQWDGEMVHKVALCGGAGAFLMQNAVTKQCDVFITGEIGYHRFFGHEHEILLMEIGHYESEQYTMEILRDIISKADATLPIHTTSVNTNPIIYK